MTTNIISRNSASKAFYCSLEKFALFKCKKQRKHPLVNFNVVDEAELFDLTNQVLVKYYEAFAEISASTSDEEEISEMTGEYIRMIVNLWFPLWSDLDSWSQAENIDLVIEKCLREYIDHP